MQTLGEVPIEHQTVRVNNARLC